MMIVILIVAFLVLAAGGFYAAWHLNRRPFSGQPARPIDLPAFLTLTDRNDEHFLRERLPAARFRRLKRQRVALTLKYVGRISSNAASVMRNAQAESQSKEHAVAQAAAQTMNRAVEVQRLCLIAFAKLIVEYVFPALEMTPAAIAPPYQALRENLNRLTTLQAQRPVRALAI